MNIALLAALISLRYKILWAALRTRNGRVLLFAVGVLLFGFMATVASLVGFQGAKILMQGKGGQEQLALQQILALAFLHAILVANLTGFGMNSQFSDRDLRRYPLNAIDRVIARHAIGILEPFWFLYLVFYLGLAHGLSAFAGIAAAILLFFCNYLAARVVDLAIRHLTTPQLVTSALLLAGLGVAFVVSSSPWQTYSWLKLTPPFAAATAIAGGGISQFLTILIWSVFLMMTLIWLENGPLPQTRRQKKEEIVWDTFIDRAGAWFGGARKGPLIAFWLRFNSRNIITRRMMILALPVAWLIAHAMYTEERQQDPNALFFAALGAMPFACILAAGRVLVNQFGHLDTGFRRLLLLPTPPSAILISAFITSTLLSLAMLLVALIGWTAAAPYPFDLRMIVMLACSCLTGIFFIHAVSVVVTIYAPSRSKYFRKLGNDLSLAANVVFMLAPLSAMFVPKLMNRIWPAAAEPTGWRLLLPLPPIAALTYVATLNAFKTTIARRRERILAVVEGKE